MKYIFHASLAASCILLSLASLRCHNQSAPTAPPSYSPPTDMRKVVHLEVGNTWKYRFVDCGIGGCDTTIDSIQIIDTTQINGNKVFQYNGYSPHITGFAERSYNESIDSINYSMYLCISCLSINISKSPGTVLNWMPLHLLVTPLTTGHRWPCANWDSLNEYGFGSLMIVNPDTTIELQSGTFHHAIHLSQDVAIGSNDYYIVPGIGVVLQEVGYFEGRTQRSLIGWRAK